VCDEKMKDSLFQLATPACVMNAKSHHSCFWVLLFFVLGIQSQIRNSVHPGLSRGGGGGGGGGGDGGGGGGGGGGVVCVCVCVW
jgi:hypothetical protein